MQAFGVAGWLALSRDSHKNCCLQLPGTYIAGIRTWSFSAQPSNSTNSKNVLRVVDIKTPTNRTNDILGWCHCLANTSMSGARHGTAGRSFVGCKKQSLWHRQNGCDGVRLSTMAQKNAGVELDCHWSQSGLWSAFEHVSQSVTFEQAEGLTNVSVANYRRVPTAKCLCWIPCQCPMPEELAVGNTTLWVSASKLTFCSRR